MHFDQTRAIILSLVSKEAQTMNYFALSNGSKKLNGKDKLPFLKRRFGIYISLNSFVQLRLTLTRVLQDHVEESSNTMQRFTLKSLLHVYIAHLSCLRTLKIKLYEFMDEAEIAEQKNLIEKL